MPEQPILEHMPRGRPRVYRWVSLYKAMRYAGYDAVRLAGELTELLGRRVEERTVEAWLRGERTPTMERLSQIAQILGRKEVYFLADRPRSREKNFAVSK